MSVIVELDYRPKLSPIRDQGPRPTCMSFATTTAHEYTRKSTELLSPEYLHYFASKKGTMVGASVSDIARALKTDGQPTEIMCPYLPGGVPKGWVPPKGIEVHRRNSDAHEKSITQLYALLRGGRAPVLGITLPEPFFAPVEPWVLSGEGPCRGLHAVLAVGIGSFEGRGCFLIRNSWGTDWGQDGYVWLAEEFVARHLMTLCTLTDEVY